MSDSVNSIMEMFEGVKEDIDIAIDSRVGDITLLSHDARDSLMRPFRRIFLRDFREQGPGQERPLEGQIRDFEDKQYGALSGEEENHNPNELTSPLSSVLKSQPDNLEQEPMPEGLIQALEKKPSSVLPSEEKVCNPNGLFAPPTPPRANKEGVKPITPPRFHTP